MMAGPQRVGPQYGGYWTAPPPPPQQQQPQQQRPYAMNNANTTWQQPPPQWGAAPEGMRQLAPAAGAGGGASPNRPVMGPGSAPHPHPPGSAAAIAAAGGGVMVNAEGQRFVVQQAWGQPGAGGGPTVMMHQQTMDWHDTLVGDCCHSTPLCCMGYLWCITPYRWAVTMTRAGLGSVLPHTVVYAIPTLVAMICFFLYCSNTRAYGSLFGVAAVFWMMMVVIACYGRTRLRVHYNIPGDQCGDFCTHCCCNCCAISQEARHVDWLTNHSDSPL